MKKYVGLLAVALGMSSAVAEPIEFASSAKRNSVWVMYTETFTRMKDAYSVIVAERSNTGQSNEIRMYAGVLLETCSNGHGALYARTTPQDNWEQMSTVTLGSPSTVADMTAIAICGIARGIDKKPLPEKRKLTI